MDFSSIYYEVQDVCTDSPIKVGSCSQCNITKTNEKTSVSLSNITETTSLGMIPDSISVSTTNDNAAITDAPVNTSDSNHFTIKKYNFHIVLSLVILFVIAFMHIPIILYYTNVSEEKPFISEIDFRNCSVYVST